MLNKHSLIVTAAVLSVTQPLWAAGRMRSADGFLEVESLRVKIQVEDTLTTTEVDQVFRNNSDKPAEAAFDFPLPAKASFSGLSIWVNDEEIQGEVIAKQRAEKVYETETGIKVQKIEQHRRRAKAITSKIRPIDPAILQMHGRVLRLRVAPVPARGLKRVRVRYVEENRLRAGIGRALLPLSLSDKSVARAKSFRCDFWIHSSRPLESVYCLSHSQGTRTQEHHPGAIYNLQFRKQDMALDRGLEFRYRLRDWGRTTMQVQCSKKTAQLTLTPWFQSDEQRQDRNVVFVLDQSQSMAKHGRRCRALVKDCLTALKSNDRFNVLGFGYSALAFSPKTRAATTVARRRALQFFDAQRCRGRADIRTLLPALKRMKKESDRQGRALEIVLISDASLADDPELIKRFASQAKRAKVRVFALELSRSVQAQKPIVQLCQWTGGQALVVQPGQEQGAGEFLRADMDVPVLFEPKIQLKGLSLKSSTPSDLPHCLREGESLAIYGQFDGPCKGQLLFSGKTSTGQLRKWAFPIHLKPSKLLDLDRIWAQRRIDELSWKLADKQLSAEQAAKLKNQRLKLALAHSLLTEDTTLIVLESEALFRKHKISRTNKDRVSLERQAARARQQQLKQELAQRVSEGPSLSQRSDTPVRPQKRWSSPSGPSGRGGGAGEPLLFLLAMAAATIGWRRES